MDVEVRGMAGVGGDPNFNLHLGDGFEKRWKSVQRVQREVESTLLLCGRQCHCKKHKTFHLGTIMLLSWNTPFSLILCASTHRPITNNVYTGSCLHPHRVPLSLPVSQAQPSWFFRFQWLCPPNKPSGRKEMPRCGAKIRVFQNLFYKTGSSKVQSPYLWHKPKTITV